MANGFLRGGMRPQSSGKGRSSFLHRSSSSMPMPPRPMNAGHEDGGDKPKDSSLAEALARLHEQHGGSLGVMHHDGMGGPVTTHHVGPAGEVSGPQEHGSPEEGADHLARMMSGMESEGSEPDGGEYAGLAE